MGIKFEIDNELLLIYWDGKLVEKLKRRYEGWI